MVYIRYCWQGKHQIYGHIRCINVFLANPTPDGAHTPHLHPSPDAGSWQAKIAATWSGIKIYGV